jgi:long-chain fatty acid transport protein
VVATILFASLGAAQTARAGAFYAGDIGTRSTARGGAFVAAPDSLLAVHYNPAGLSLLSGFHAEFSLSPVLLDFEFQRSCPCVDPNLPNAAMLDADLEAKFDGNPTKSSTPLYIPFLAVGYGLPIYDLTIALAAWGPHSGNYEFGGLPEATSPAFERAADRAPHRYSALSVDTLELNFALGFGLQPIEGLRIGGTIIMYQNANDQAIHLWLNSTSFASSPELSSWDVPLTLHFRRNFALNFTLGASYELIPGLTVGASFRGKRSLRADGTLDISLPQVVQDIGGMVEGNEIEIEVNTAPITRFGVQYEMPKVFKAEAALVYEYWQTYSRVLVRPKNIIVTLPGSDPQSIQPIVQDRRWENTYSLRVGGEMNLFDPWFRARAGYFYEPGAIPLERLDASRVDLDKHGFSLGAGTTYNGFTLELAAQYIALDTTEVTNSQVRLSSTLAPPLGSDELLTTIGNGTYSAHYTVLSASLSFALDPLLDL